MEIGSDMTSLANPVRRPLVSIIVPSYNYGHFIEMTLDSVVAQTYEEIECVVVDDGSTDDTAERVARFIERDERFLYLYKTNEGLGAARNTGIINSRGEYLQFLDSDDLLEFQKVSQQVEFLENHPDIDIVYGGAFYFLSDDMDRTLAPKCGNPADWVPKLSASDEQTLLTLIKHPMPVNAPLIRRRVIEDVGLFETAIRQVEDWDFWIRCAARGKRFQFQDRENTVCSFGPILRACQETCADALGQCIVLREKVARQPYPPEVLRKNQAMKVATIGHCGIEEIARRNFLSGLILISRAAFLSQRPREKAKWLLCMILSPFVPQDVLRRLVVTPLTQIMRLFFSGRCIK